MEIENKNTPLESPDITKSTQESTVLIKEESQQSMHKKEKYWWLSIFLVILFFGLTGVFAFRYHKPKQSKPPSTGIEVSSPITSEQYSFSYSFCKGSDYCSMNEICSNVPTSHGVSFSDEDRNNQYLCGQKEALLNGVMEVKFLGPENMFVEDSLPEEGKTRIGYVLVRNGENSKQKAEVVNFECLNYEGLCEDVKVIYPSSFLINKKDVAVFPVYIEKLKDLEGLISVEFSIQVGNKLPMFSVDLIFNGDKTCIYQWGVLGQSRRIYFNEPSKVDWTEYCQ
jgi:hypothetical protein